ncbi:MAG TPA: imidazole glycerol phosphate synthase subunit HisH [Egibacteraceae bacterium]|nr:imidazole glycerol phosphate synthase subunit HisH [Egibacteraceae bacterium]
MTPPRVAVLDYGAGNLRSMEKALVRSGGEVVVTSDAAEAAAADALVVPGVGNFGQCVRQFRDEGLEDLTRRWVDQGRPLLGVCVGMQILYASSEEAPDTPGLAVLPGEVRRLPAGVVVPHMGWNTLEPGREDPLLAGLAGAHAYFVHSYYVGPDAAQVVATCDYGVRIAAVIRAGSVVGTQFHPEKSSDVGARLLANWLDEVARREHAA